MHSRVWRAGRRCPILNGESTNAMENERKDEPNVHVFGKPIDEKRCRRREERESAGEIGGLMFLLAGLILLLNSLNAVPWDVWQHVWPFWPVLVVVIGAQIMLGKGPVGRIIAFALALFLFLAVTGSALRAVGSPVADYVPDAALRFIDALNVK